MVYISLNNEYPTLYFGYVDFKKVRSIEKDPILLLIEEVIDYSLRHHNLNDWNPPVDLKYARKINKFTYFNENFAAAVVSPKTEEEALDLAKKIGFDEQKWLSITDHYEAISFQKDYLLQIYDHNAPCLVQMFSFACYASRIALERKLNHLANDVVWALLNTLRKVLTNEEYFMDFYFIPDECNDQDMDNQIDEIDEGYGSMVEEDDFSKGIENCLSSIRIDPILLFVIELINYSLHLNNLDSWIPIIGFGVLHRTEMTYFTENIGRAINHPFAEAEAMRAAQEHGYDEDSWLEIHKPTEAINFQNYFLQQVFLSNNDLNQLSMFSFVSYSSKLAMRGNRSSLVNQVASALVDFLREYYPHQQCYREFDACAHNYNALHKGMHSQSDDERVEDIENETVDADEDITNLLEGETVASAEENEAEENDSLYSTVEKYANEGSGIDVLEKNSARYVLEDVALGELEKEIGMLGSKAVSVTRALKAEFEAEENDSLHSAVKQYANEGSGIDAPVKNSAGHVLVEIALGVFGKEVRILFLQAKMITRAWKAEYAALTLEMKKKVNPTVRKILYGISKRYRVMFLGK